MADDGVRALHTFTFLFQNELLKNCSHDHHNECKSFMHIAHSKYACVCVLFCCLLDYPKLCFIRDYLLLFLSLGWAGSKTELICALSLSLSCSAYKSICVCVKVYVSLYMRAEYQFVIHTIAELGWIVCIFIYIFRCIYVYLCNIDRLYRALCTHTVHNMGFVHAPSNYTITKIIYRKLQYKQCKKISLVVHLALL